MTIFGYLDPGTGTLIVQAVLGGAAGAAVLFKTTGRRLFKKNGSAGETKAESEGDIDDVQAPASAD